jgi:thermitase
MKSSIIIFFLLVSVAFNTSKCKSQDHYYFYKGEKISLDVNENAYYITMSDTSNFKQKCLNSKLSISEIKHGANQEKGGKGYWKIINIKNDTLSKKARRDWLISNSQIKHVQSVIGDKYPVALSEYLYIKLKAMADTVLLNKVTNEKLCKIIGPVAHMPLWYSVQVPEKSNTLDVSNSLYSSKYFQEVDPGFIFNFSHQCISDPLFNQQWALQDPNSGIQACAAWNITRGNAAVKVAVVDQGIDLTHQEFSTNILPISYNAQTNSQNAQVYGVHATHVAGIIGANQNGIQISGIAPKTSLMNICHSLSVSPTFSQELASGISYAWQNGADIINNSWGDQGGSYYNNIHSALLEDAINNAITNGRNGLGCIVVFASGNYSPVIDYPAYYRPEILCVGSTNNVGNKSTYSGYGTSLDVVAPGENILSTLPNNETGLMSGTSMATPYVSGVAALLLSVNPTLTGQRVRDIIESTCTKIGSYNYATISGRTNGTWNNEMGYGLINAYAAVSAANLLISGPSQICDQGTYTINNLPAGATVVWSATPSGIVSLQQNGNSVMLTKVGGGKITLSAAINNSFTVMKDVWVGVPKLLSYTTSPKQLCPDEPFIFNPVIPDGCTITNATGLSGGVEISLSGINSSSYEVPGDVSRITLSIENSCGDVTVHKLIPKANCQNYSFSITPNPSSNTTTISMIPPTSTSTPTLMSASECSSLSASYSVKVMDAYGSIVYMGTKQGKQFTISTSSFRNGVYAVIVSDGTNTYQNKLIVKH